MTAPQIVMLVLVGLALVGAGIKFTDHRQPLRGFFTDLLGIGLMQGLLFWGGFWS